MQKTTPMRLKEARKVLTEILDDSTRQEEELVAAQGVLRAAAEELGDFRTAHPDCAKALSWTSIGRERDLLEARVKEAIRRWDRCRGAVDLSANYRLLIEQTFRGSGGFDSFVGA